MISGSIHTFTSDKIFFIFMIQYCYNMHMLQIVYNHLLKKYIHILLVVFFHLTIWDFALEFWIVNTT